MTAPVSGAAFVRVAVADYITAATIPLLSKVYADPPFDTNDIDWSVVKPAGTTTNAIGMVFIDTEDDEVIAFDGAGGRRKVTYAVSLEMLFVDISGTASTAQSAMDTVIQSVKQQLRTDPQLGTAAAPGMASNGGIIQAAYARLHVERGRPIRPGQGNGFGCGAALGFDVETYEFST